VDSEEVSNISNLANIQMLVHIYELFDVDQYV
jgi:hypothetical protein